jgi:hypothetical protein
VCRRLLKDIPWNFCSLGQVPAGIEDEELVLNISEQLLGTILQALPEKMLPKYLPPGVEVRLPYRGLMVARPMSQGHKNAANDSWMLWKSTNSLTLQYAKEHPRETRHWQTDAGRLTTSTANRDEACEVQESPPFPRPRREPRRLFNCCAVVPHMPNETVGRSVTNI